MKKFIVYIIFLFLLSSCQAFEKAENEKVWEKDYDDQNIINKVWEQPSTQAIKLYQDAKTKAS